MGTLFNQKTRSYYEIDDSDLLCDIDDINAICKETGWTVENVLKLKKIHQIKRANDLYVANGDAHDEQMAGFGELIKEFFSMYQHAHVLHMNSPSAFEKIAMEMAEFRTAIIDAAEIISKGDNDVTIQ